MDLAASSTNTISEFAKSLEDNEKVLNIYNFIRMEDTFIIKIFAIIIDAKHAPYQL